LFGDLCVSSGDVRSISRSRSLFHRPFSKGGGFRIRWCYPFFSYPFFDFFSLDGIPIAAIKSVTPTSGRFLGVVVRFDLFPLGIFPFQCFRRLNHPSGDWCHRFELSPYFFLPIFIQPKLSVVFASSLNCPPFTRFFFVVLSEIFLFSFKGVLALFSGSPGRSRFLLDFY